MRKCINSIDIWQEMAIPFSKAILDLNNRNVMMNILKSEEFQLDSNDCQYQVCVVSKIRSVTDFVTDLIIISYQLTS